MKDKIRDLMTQKIKEIKQERGRIRDNNILVGALLTVLLLIFQSYMSIPPVQMHTLPDQMKGTKSITAETTLST